MFYIFTNKPYYSIGELSTICDIPQKTLRYYDDIGLFVPDYRDNDTHYRYYSKSQIINLVIIRSLKQMGFSLKEIKDIVDQNDAEALERNMLQKLEDMKNTIMKEIDRYTECCYLLNKIQNGVNILETSSPGASKDLQISIEHIPEISLLFDNQLMKDYDYSEMSLDRWISIMRKGNQSKHKVAGPVFVTCYDQNILNKFLSQDTMMEFAIQIENTAPNQEIRTFGGFDAATVIHVGNYKDIPNTYIQMIKWIKQNHYCITGPATEEFILSLLDVNDETRRVTKIILPVKREADLPKQDSSGIGG